MKKIAAPLPEAMAVFGQCPLVLLTCNSDGLRYVMPAAWTMGNNYDPPRVAVTLGPWNATYEALKKEKSCVINAVSKPLAAAAFKCGSTHTKPGFDKYEAFGIESSAAETARGEILEESFASLECRVISEDPEHGLFLLEGTRYLRADEAETCDRSVLHSLGDVLYADDGERFEKEKLV